MSLAPAAAIAQPVEIVQSAGCTGEASTIGKPGETTRHTLQVGELKREFLLHRPASLASTIPAALVLDFHGYTGTAAQQEADSELSRFADERGFVAVFPQGTSFTDDRGQFTSSWNDLAGNASPGPLGPTCSDDAFDYADPPECGEPSACNWSSCHDDVGFVRAIVAEVEKRLCIDPNRVYATGSSNGGMFVHRLACDVPELFAAVAPVMGTLARGFNCAPGVPLSLLNIYGSQDRYVDQERPMSSDGFFYTAADDVLSKWADADSQMCDPLRSAFPVKQAGERDLACTQHAECSGGSEVVHCTFDGAHEWPKTKARNFGTELILDFFDRHTRSVYGRTIQ